MTKLPQPLPVDLAQVKSLIDERVLGMAAEDEIVAAATVRKNTYQEEITALQDQAKKLLQITPKEEEKKPKRDPKTGERIKEGGSKSGTADTEVSALPQDGGSDSKKNG